jgi:hypothetical protein
MSRHLITKGIVMYNSKFAAYMEAVFAVVIWGASFIATKVPQRDRGKALVCVRE